MKTDFPTCTLATGAQQRVQLAGLVLLFFCLFLPLLSDSAAAQEGVEFDHFSTGFPLEGAHAMANCTSCHLRGIFEGTPVTCTACHNQASLMGGDKLPQDHIRVLPLCEDCHTDQFWKPLARMSHDAVIGSCSNCHDGTTATGKTPGHFQSGNSCDDCHSTHAWVPARFDHSSVIASCSSCHNGSTASGKTPQHIPSANSCDDCHSTHAWLPAVFDHNSVTGNCSSCHNGTTATGKHTAHIQSTAVCEDCHGTTTWSPAQRVDHAAVLGTCFSCHNGTTASGKTPLHIQSPNSCDDCHTTNAWLPAVFDHSAVSPGTCTSCHNGSTASGKLPNHIITAAQCDACHTTIAWLPASFDHNLVTGSCSGCHNGTTATGKIASHLVTSRECDECHSTNLWIPINFRHTSPLYPGDHSGNPPCITCHQANSELVTWSAPAYVPDCAACHATDFKPSSHKKYENPDTFYSVSELRDCSGSCHMYTDSNMTTIKNNEPGPEHRVTDSSFD